MKFPASVSKEHARELLLKNKQYASALADLMASRKRFWTGESSQEEQNAMSEHITDRVVAALESQAWIADRARTSLYSDIGLSPKQLRELPTRIRKLVKVLEGVADNNIYFAPPAELPAALEGYAKFLDSKVFNLPPLRRGRRKPIAQYSIHPGGVALFSNYIYGTTNNNHRFHREVGNLLSTGAKALHPKGPNPTLGESEVAKIVSEYNNHEPGRRWLDSEDMLPQSEE